MAENGSRCGVNPTNSEAGGYSNGTNELDPIPDSGKKIAKHNEVTQKYIQNLLQERLRMENHFPLAVQLIDEALERVQLNGRLPTREQYADVYQQRTIKLSQKVHVPIKDKKFNYVGKLLGPKGNSLRRLQEETQCKIVILGRFSMKDRLREEELRNSADAKYAHLNLPLHVEVSTIAPPAEAYARVAYALAELRRYLIPDKHDDIRQEQFRELMEDPEAAKKITMRQQQQQQNNTQSGGGGQFSNNSFAGGSYRSKHQHQQFTKVPAEPVYFRLQNNTYHQLKPYISGNQRSNVMNSSMPPQTIANSSPSGLHPSTHSYNGRGPITTAGMVSNNTPVSGCVPSSPRFRSFLPHQFVKK